MKIKQNCRFIRELTSIGSAHLHLRYKPLNLHSKTFY